MSLKMIKLTLKDAGFKFSDDKVEEIKTTLQHQFVPALEFCGWLPCDTKKEFDIKQKVQSTHPYCCFNHLVGLPKKEHKDEEGNITEGEEVDLTEYERRVIINYETNYKYANNKCRGAGLTTLFVRHYAYKYAITNTIPDRKALICAGNGLLLSLDIMHRIKLVLDKIPFVYKVVPTSEKPREIYCKTGGIIMSIAAEVITLAGLENVGDIMGDEITKWNLVDDTPVLKTILPYVSKSFAHLAFFGTPYGQRGFAYDRIFNPVLLNTSGFFVQVLNWREALGIPEIDIEIIRDLIGTPRDEIKKIYKRKYNLDEEYKIWFHEYFGDNSSIDGILSITTPLLDLQEIIDTYDNERETYDQEFDNQYIVPSDSLMGDHNKHYSTEDFEAEDIGVPE